jgi:hypothetical protein
MDFYGTAFAVSIATFHSLLLVSFSIFISLRVLVAVFSSSFRPASSSSSYFLASVIASSWSCFNLISSLSLSVSLAFSRSAISFSWAILARTSAASFSFLALASASSLSYSLSSALYFTTSAAFSEFSFASLIFLCFASSTSYIFFYFSASTSAIFYNLKVSISFAFISASSFSFFSFSSFYYLTNASYFNYNSRSYYSFNNFYYCSLVGNHVLAVLFEDQVRVAVVDARALHRVLLFPCGPFHHKRL